MIRSQAQKELSWIHFVSRSGPAAAEWVSEYRRFDAQMRKNFEALLMSRRNQLVPAFRLSEEIEREVELGSPPESSLRFILLRYIYAVRGYTFYQKGCSDEAHRCMDFAGQCIANAIELDSFLISLAESCNELVLHHARIARNDRRWPDMFRHLERARRMMAGDVPLCTLSDGCEIDFEAIEQYYLSLGPLDSAEAASLEDMRSADTRLTLLADFVRRILALPGHAISYP